MIRDSMWLRAVVILVAVGLGGTRASASEPSESEPREEPSPVGVWKTIDDDTGKAKSHVEITDRDGKLWGRITKLLNLPPEEGPNPLCTECEGARKDQPIKGMTIMWNMEKRRRDWRGGHILDPENGNTYRCRIWLDGPDKLMVRGYLGPFFRTQTWHRVK